MSRLHQFIKQNGLRSVGRHHVFMDQRGNPILIRETTQRTRLRGDDVGDDVGDDDFVGGAFDPSYMGADFRVYSPSYMGDDDFIGDDDYDVVEDELGRRMMMRRGGGGGGGGGGRHGRRINQGAHGAHYRRGLSRMGPRFDHPSADESYRSDVDMNSHVNAGQAMVPEGWCATVVNGGTTLTAAGPAQIQIRLQHDFLATDIAFDGSSAGATVNSIVFGDRLVWQTQTGAPATVFAANTFIRNLLNGQRLRAGLDIIINGQLTGAGSFTATLFGSKPYAVALGQ